LFQNLKWIHDQLVRDHDHSSFVVTVNLCAICRVQFAYQY